MMVIKEKMGSRKWDKREKRYDVWKLQNNKALNCAVQ
jgi:hypothetical protein